MNTFDAAIYVCMIVAVVAGFRSGLLRSMATIFGYVAATPIAVAATPGVMEILIEQFHVLEPQPWLVLIGIFVVGGTLLGALLRLGVSALVGPQVSYPDRFAGAMLGAVRIGLLAVLLVLLFDRIIPTGRDPAFLAGSRLRPVLSNAGLQGLRSLPPDVGEFIDRLKRSRGI